MNVFGLCISGDVYIYYLWNKKFERLVGPLDKIVTVSVVKYNVILSLFKTTSWRHSIQETRCQDVGCFILYLILFPSFELIFSIVEFGWIRDTTIFPYRCYVRDTLKDVYLSQLPHIFIKRLAKLTVRCEPLVL